MIQDAIKLAIEKGRWDVKAFLGCDTDDAEVLSSAIAKASSLAAEVIQSSAFWQALGKAKGWPEKFSNPGARGFVDAWRYHRLRYLDLIADSQEKADKYLASLL